MKEARLQNCWNPEQVMQKGGLRRPLKLWMLIWEDDFDPSRWFLNIITSFFVRGRELETWFQIENRPSMEQSGEKLL